MTLAWNRVELIVSHGDSVGANGGVEGRTSKALGLLRGLAACHALSLMSLQQSGPSNPIVQERAYTPTRPLSRSSCLEESS